MTSTRSFDFCSALNPRTTRQKIAAVRLCAVYPPLYSVCLARSSTSKPRPRASSSPLMRRLSSSGEKSASARGSTAPHNPERNARLPTARAFISPGERTFCLSRLCIASRWQMRMGYGHVNSEDARSLMSLGAFGTGIVYVQGGTSPDLSFASNGWVYKFMQL